MKDLGVTIGDSNDYKIHETINITNKNDTRTSIKSLSRYRFVQIEKKNVYLITTGCQNCIKIQWNDGLQ